MLKICGTLNSCQRFEIRVIGKVTTQEKLEDPQNRDINEKQLHLSKLRKRKCNRM